jgi:transcription-repair coupling factor (superfamily II helicase)
MDAYRKIAIARGGEDIEQIKGELTDVYGPIPDEVKLLLDLAELRIKASKCDIKSIVASGQDLIFSFAKDVKAPSESFFSKISGKACPEPGRRIRISDSRTAYLRLSKNYFEPRTLISVLRKILGEED